MLGGEKMNALSMARGGFMDWVTRLLTEYKEGRKQVGKLYNSLEKDNPERKVVGGMIRDMDFTIEWLKTGRMPGQIKGIDLKRVYKIRERFNKPIKYGVSSYWDSSVNAFVSKSSYTDPFLEVEGRIDKELKLRANGF